MDKEYTGDCYICTIDCLDDICDTLIAKGCNILNAVPVDYYIERNFVKATKMCITFERPKKPIGSDKTTDNII